MSGWGSVIDRIAKDLHEGKIKPSDLNRDYILKTGSDLRSAVNTGYSRTVYNPSDVQMNMRMMQNAYIFSSAKNVVFQQQVASLVRDADGKLRSFHEFKKDVLKLDKTYNQTYLQAEHQTAMASAQSAKRWQDFEKRADRYPNLEYKTVGDDHVREAHIALNGIVRPIGHSFWNTYNTPNGYRCRCYVVQTDKKPNGDEVPTMDEKNVPTAFRLNPGKTATALPEGHPYFKYVKDKKINPIVPDSARKLIPFEEVKMKDATVYVHPLSEPQRTEFIKNIKAAELVAAKVPKEKMEVMFHLNEKKVKNPEYRLKGVIGDRVESTSVNSIRNAFTYKYGKNGQLKALDNSWLVFDFGNTKLSLEELTLIARALNGEMKASSRNRFNFLIFGNRTVRIDEKMTWSEIEKAITQ